MYALDRKKADRPHSTAKQHITMSSLKGKMDKYSGPETP
jgi:hypothetical protein